MMTGRQIEFWRHQAARFLRARDGNIAIIFALALIPIIAAVGAGIDYSRTSGIKTRVQAALDAALLAASVSAETNKTTRDRKAKDYFNAHLHDLPSDIKTKFEITEKGSGLYAKATAAVPTTLMNVVGIKNVDISAEATTAIAGGGVDLEIALVVDVTDSMNQKGKLRELKKASFKFIDMMKGLAKKPDVNVKIALVPFADKIKLDRNKYKNKNWFYIERIPNHKKWKWNGCLWDRNMPYDTNNTTPKASNRQTLFSIGKREGTKSHWCTYPILQPLTDNLDSIRTGVSNLHALKNTNITIGLAWGMHALMPNVPLTEAAPVGQKGLKKIIILMTDGDNTESRHYYYQYHHLDLRTKKTCDNIKLSGIDEIYTIRLINGNEDLLKYCASSANNYTNVTNPEKLQSVYERIGRSIVKSVLRLTS